MIYRPGHPVVALFAVMITIAPLLGAGLAAIMVRSPHWRAVGVGETYALAALCLAWSVERLSERSISPATTSAAGAR